MATPSSGVLTEEQGDPLLMPKLAVEEEGAVGRTTVALHE